jgi:hypothetical protein
MPKCDESRFHIDKSMSDQRPIAYPWVIGPNKAHRIWPISLKAGIWIRLHVGVTRFRIELLLNTRPRFRSCFAKALSIGSYNVEGQSRIDIQKGFAQRLPQLY